MTTWDKKTVFVLSHITYLGLLRPFLSYWLRLTFSGIEHIIGEAEAVLVVNLKPRE
jgi:hypothetical protein